MNFRELQFQIHKNAVEHGWWEKHRGVPEALALIHSEVSEALEDYRDKKDQTVIKASGKPVGFPVELADIVIRVLDLAEHLDIDLQKEIERKHDFNTSRPYRHGGKRC